MKMNWEKLIDIDPNEVFWRGTIIRIPSAYPYEEIVDHVICDLSMGQGAMSLITMSGYHAGQLHINFARESTKNNNSHTLSAGWLQDTWDEGWIAPKCDINYAWVCRDGYPVPKTLPDGTSPPEDAVDRAPPESNP